MKKFELSQEQIRLIIETEWAKATLDGRRKYFEQIEARLGAVSDEEKLTVLREHQLFGVDWEWESLDDKIYCRACRQWITGRDVRVYLDSRFLRKVKKRDQVIWIDAERDYDGETELVVNDPFDETGRTISLKCGTRLKNGEICSGNPLYWTRKP